MGNSFACKHFGGGVEPLYSGDRFLIPSTEVVCSLGIVGVEAKGACLLVTEDGDLMYVNEDNPDSLVGVNFKPMGVFGIGLNHIPHDVRSIFFIATLGDNEQLHGQSFKNMTSGYAELKCPGKDLCRVSLTPFIAGTSIVFLALYREASWFDPIIINPLDDYPNVSQKKDRKKEDHSASHSGSHESFLQGTQNGTHNGTHSTYKGGWSMEVIAKCYHCFDGGTTIDEYLALQPCLEDLFERGMRSRPTQMLGSSDTNCTDITHMSVPYSCFAETTPYDDISVENLPVHVEAENFNGNAMPPDPKGLVDI